MQSCDVYPRPVVLTSIDAVSREPGTGSSHMMGISHSSVIKALSSENVFSFIDEHLGVVPSAL